MTLEQLLERRNRALSEARAFVDGQEIGQETGESEQGFQRAMDEVRKCDKWIEDTKALMKIEAENADARAAVEDIVRPKEVRKLDELHAQEIREFVTQGSPRTTLFIPAPERRTALITTDAATTYASYTVPEQWWNTVQMHVNAASGVLASNVTVLRTAGGEEINIPTLATDAAAALTAQAAAPSEVHPVFGQNVLNAYRLDGYFTVSKEFLQDSAINVEGFLQEAASRAIATLAASYAATGTGSSQPQGVNDSTEVTTAGVTTAVATDFTMDEVWDLYLSVLPGYRARGEWIASSTAYAKLMKMKNDEGSYMISNPTSTEPAMLIGKPLREDSGFEACTAALCPLFFGDFSTYWVRWARGLEFTRDDSFAFTSFASTFRWAAWFDTEFMNVAQGAVKHMIMHT
jgi:HK97 family phage major capsid protein